MPSQRPTQQVNSLIPASRLALVGLLLIALLALSFVVDCDAAKKKVSLPHNNNPMTHDWHQPSDGERQMAGKACQALSFSSCHACLTRPPCFQKSKKAKSAEPKKDEDGEDQPKVKKAWKDMTKADWDKLEREAESEGEEPFKMPEPPKVEFDPSNPSAYLKAGIPSPPSARHRLPPEPYDGVRMASAGGRLLC